MTNTISIADRKTKKQIKALVEKINAAVKVMDVSIRALDPLKALAPVAEAISSLKTNKTIMEIHLNKLKRADEDLDG